MKRLLGCIVVLLGSGTVASCASPPAEIRPSDSVSFFGRVIDRSDVAAQPKWAVNQDFTLGMGGILGVMLAESQGTAKHFRYVVEDSQGKIFEIRTRTDVALHACVEIVVPKALSQSFRWMPGEAFLQPSQTCKS